MTKRGRWHRLVTERATFGSVRERPWKRPRPLPPPRTQTNPRHGFAESPTAMRRARPAATPDEERVGGSDGRVRIH